MQTEKLLLVIVVIVVAILLVNTILSWFKPSFEKALMDEYKNQTVALQKYVDSLETIRAARVDTIKQIERQKTVIGERHTKEVVYLLAIMDKDSLITIKDSLRHVLGWNPRLLEVAP
jgi:hypothetical protein